MEGSLKGYSAAFTLHEEPDSDSALPVYISKSASLSTTILQRQKLTHFWHKSLYMRHLKDLKNHRVSVIAALGESKSSGHWD